MADSEYFIGTWRLESWIAVLPNGETIYPVGKKPIGYLMYNLEGFMAVEMMAGDDASHFSYFATYQVLSEEVVVHFVKVCSYANFINSRQERFVNKIDSERMVLTSPPSEETGQVNHLTWKRIRGEK